MIMAGVPERRKYAYQHRMAMILIIRYVQSNPTMISTNDKIEKMIAIITAINFMFTRT